MQLFLLIELIWYDPILAYHMLGHLIVIPNQLPVLSSLPQVHDRIARGRARILIHRARHLLRHMTRDLVRAIRQPQALLIPLVPAAVGVTPLVTIHVGVNAPAIDIAHAKA